MSKRDRRAGFFRFLDSETAKRVQETGHKAETDKQYRLCLAASEARRQHNAKYNPPRNPASPQISREGEAILLARALKDAKRAAQRGYYARRQEEKFLDSFEELQDYIE